MIDITQPGGIDRFMADITKHVNEQATVLTEDTFKKVDRSVRSQCEGKPSGEVLTAARRIFNEAGIDAPEEALHDYASAVSRSAPYRFHIRVNLK